MEFMTTASNWDFTTTPYYLNCTKTGTSIINNTITTPFESFETTTYDALSTSSETIKIISMVCAIFGMVTLTILYAGCYRMCCSGNQPYHDSCIKATIHIVLTLLTYVLYLFDTLSDVFLFLHYIAIGQTSKFALVMPFTFAPVLFLAFIFFAKHHKKLECDYHKLSCREQLCFQMFGLVLVLVCSPFAALVFHSLINL